MFLLVLADDVGDDNDEYEFNAARLFLLYRSWWRCCPARIILVVRSAADAMMDRRDADAGIILR